MYQISSKWPEFYRRYYKKYFVFFQTHCMSAHEYYSPFFILTKGISKKFFRLIHGYLNTLANEYYNPLLTEGIYRISGFTSV